MVEEVAIHNGRSTKSAKDLLDFNVLEVAERVGSIKFNLWITLLN